MSTALLLMGQLMVVQLALLDRGVFASPSPAAADWHALNASVGGRLHATVPFGLPCFSTFGGKPVTRDPDVCSMVQHSYTDPIYRIEYFGAYMNSQWETCQATGAGCLLDNTNPGNPLAFDSTDCKLGNLATYHIDVGSVKDVQAAFAFSLFTGVRLSVKSHGHDYKGRSSGKETLGLWLAKLNSIAYDPSFVPEACNETYPVITIGPGAKLEDIYSFADEHNTTFIGGYHRTIGSGYFLGGGHSVLSPVFGLGVDRVVQVKVVTPDGQFRIANECQNSDLFWALRGGGGSAFGVVTELSLRVEPRVTLQAAIIRIAGNISTLADWYNLTVYNSLRWGHEGWGGHITGTGLVHVNPKLSNLEAQASMEAAIDFAVSHGGSGFIDELSSWNAFFTKYVTTVEAPVGPELMLGTRLLPTTLFETENSRANLSIAIRDVLPFSSPYIVVGTPLLFPYVKGTTSVTPAWRRALWHFGLHGQFFFNSTLEDRRTKYTQVDQHIQVFRDMSPGSGAYFNEGDVYEPDHEYSYWGDNYLRLLAVKQKYDPHHLMDCWQCVGWKGPSDPLYSCYIRI